MWEKEKERRKRQKVNKQTLHKSNVIITFLSCFLSQFYMIWCIWIFSRQNKIFLSKYQDNYRMTTNSILDFYVEESLHFYVEQFTKFAHIRALYPLRFYYRRYGRNRIDISTKGLSHLVVA